MRDSCLPLLACPSCRAGFAMEVVVREPDGHVMTGALACKGCKGRYPILRGIPRLIPDAVNKDATETAARFAAEWTRFADHHEYDEKWFRAWIDPLGPEDFAGKTVLEGGCGKGRHTVIAARWGASAVLSLDLGDSIEVAFQHTRSLENAHVAQADVVHPPVRRDFDVVFSLGVLHHLPEPKAGFDALRGLVKRGGKMAVWVYGYESNEWIVRYVNPVRERVTARMPAQLLYWLSLPPSAALAAAAKLYQQPQLRRKLPYRDYMKQLSSLPVREVHSIVFDQLVTPIAYYLPEDEVRSWFANAAFEDVTIGWHNQNSWRGSGTVIS